MNINKYIQSILKIKNLIFYLLLISLFLLILLYVFKGLSIIFWIIFLFWISFFVIYFLKIQITFFTKYFIYIFIFLLVINVFSLIFIKGSKKGTTTTKQLSAEECKPYYDKYNGKVLKISGDNLKGTVGIKIDPDKCKLSGQYIVTFTTSLPENPDTNFPGSTPYNYVVLLRENLNTSREYTEHGALSVVRENANQLPDPYTEFQSISKFYAEAGKYYEGGASNFYWTYKIDTNFSQARYDQIFKDKYLQIVDGLPFIEVEDMGGGIKSSSINHDKAEMNGNIVKTFELKISE